LALKLISQGVYKGGIDSGAGFGPNGTLVDALATSCGPSRTFGGVTKLENRPKMAKTPYLKRITRVVWTPELVPNPMMTSHKSEGCLKLQI